MDQVRKLSEVARPEEFDAGQARGQRLQHESYDLRAVQRVGAESLEAVRVRKSVPLEIRQDFACASDYQLEYFSSGHGRVSFIDGV